MSAKSIVRKQFRRIKLKYLQNQGNNYHSSLKNNLKLLLQQYNINGLMGSYIYVPNKQIIPPHLAQFEHCFPIFTKNNRNMEFCNSNKFVIGDYGFMIPQYGNNAEYQVFPQVVLVPLTAFNEQKQRIGQGGGYYDTYIKKMNRLKKQCKFIGVGLQCLRIQDSTQKQNIFEEHDQKLDYIITQNRIYK